MPEIATLSVAISTINRPDDLILCLTELLKGQVLPGEVIIVDQSDCTAAREFLDQLAESPIPIKYIHQDCKGLSASRNAAIKLAKNPLLAFTDDDCVPDQNWVSVINHSFSTSPIPDLVCGSVLPYGSISEGKYSISPREQQNRVDYHKRTIPWLIGTGGNCAVKTDLFQRIGVFNERLGAGSPGRAAEDADLLYRSLSQGARIRYEPGAVIYHKQQDRDKRLASRWSYGYGIGAFCGIWLRKPDFYMLYILADWLVSRLAEMGKFALKGNWFEVLQRLLNITGTFSGLPYGLSNGSVPAGHYKT